jgi:hypothetical protein
LRDSDVVVVPQTPIKRLTDLIELGFTRGVNELIPLLQSLGVLELSNI